MGLAILAAALLVVSTASTQPCPRPADKDGNALYHVVSGKFVERKTDEGGARFVVVAPVNAAANEALRVTQEVYDAVERIERGRAVRLFSYVKSASSGANPAFSCIEF